VGEWNSFNSFLKENILLFFFLFFLFSGVFFGSICLHHSGCFTSGLYMLLWCYILSFFFLLWFLLFCCCCYWRCCCCCCCCLELHCYCYHLTLVAVSNRFIGAWATVSVGFISLRLKHDSEKKLDFKLRQKNIKTQMLPKYSSVICADHFVILCVLVSFQVAWFSLTLLLHVPDNESSLSVWACTSDGDCKWTIRSCVVACGRAF